MKYLIILYSLSFSLHAQTELTSKDIKESFQELNDLHNKLEPIRGNKCYDDKDASIVISCAKPIIIPKSDNAISAPTLLILTHPTSFFDNQLSAKNGINKIESWAKANGIESLLLHDEGEQEKYYYSNCNPTYAAYSENGELNIPVTSKKVYLAGGYYHACLTHTIEGLITRKEKENLDITLVSDAIYVAGTLLQRSDAQYSKEVTAYMKKTKQKYIPLSVIIEKIMANRYSNEKLDYLKDYFKLSSIQYGNDLSSYKQIISVNNKEEVVIESSNQNAPILRFNIITSDEISKN